MSSRYWAGSAFVNRMRGWFGIEKPGALQWGEWDEWKKKVQQDHPIGYWLTEELPGHLERIPETFVDPFHNISYYIRNRWHRQTHVLPTGFKPGTYHDLRERLLYGCMESLVDFVEVEKAWMTYICDDTDTIKLGKGGRSPEAGLKHLEWEMTLDDPALSETERSPSQATCAREIYEIYTWWKTLRPARPDPMDVSGWSAHCSEIRKQGYDLFDERRPETPEEETSSKAMLKSLRDIEEAQDQEDEQMLVRLMKIRLHLWT